MKNKKTLYFLIPALIVVWGTIAYKIFTATNNDNDVPTIQRVSKPISKESRINDTFSLYLSYRDPFLGRQQRYSQITPAEKSAKKPKGPPAEGKKEDIQWPQIIYGGMIKNKKSARELALIKINNQESIFQPGEKKNEITVVRITRDSVLIQYREKAKTFYK